ncbi:MAG: YicC family protein [Spirochaetaceae bacterium]|nr:YicC family protein [Spirochaetaceae bacterium]
MNSMTGYAYSEEYIDNCNISIEIKSYNSKYFDLSINMPSFLSRLENSFREKFSNLILRGKVEVYIRVFEENPTTNVIINEEAVKSYAEAFKKIAVSLGQPSDNIPLELIVRQEGVISSRCEYDIERYLSLISPVLENTINLFIEDRKREGENLKIDLLNKVSELDKALSFFQKFQPKMEAAFKENVTKRFYEMLGDKIDEQRILAEVAALLVKYTINEEIVRLESHIKALKSELQENTTPGRKIDFLCQEINREINTIGSKNQFVEVGNMVVSAKNALENIREQARNVE